MSAPKATNADAEPAEADWSAVRVTPQRETRRESTGVRRHAHPESQLADETLLPAGPSGTR